MKRFLLLLITACFCLSLNACFTDAPYASEPENNSTAQTPGQTQPTSEPSAPTTTPEQQPYPYPMAAISLPLMESTRHAGDGKPIFTYSFQTMTLVIPDLDAAKSITVDYLNETDFSGSAAEAVDKAAQTAYTGQADWTEYFYRNLYTPTRMDQSILSLYGTKTYYDGAPHSTVVAQGLTYDLLHGTPLTLRQLLVSNFDSAALCSLITRHFDAAQTEYFYPDYAVVIEDMFSTNVPVEDWYLSEDGLCFFFNPGEIAPYSEEIPVSTIPYSELNELLQEAFFPAESVAFWGEPILKALGASEIPQFDHIVEVIVDAQAPRYCLSTNGTIQNLRIHLGSWDSNGTFTPETTIFAAQALTDGTAALLQCPADWIEKLCITYESGEQQYTVSAKTLLS